MAAKTPKIDLTDLLPEEDRQRKRQEEAERRAEEERKRTAHIPKNLDKPEALVMFWNHYSCKCGRSYSAPGYHPSPVMVRILEKDGGEQGNSTYRYEQPRPDHPGDLKLEQKISTFSISTCPGCMEKVQHIPQEEQLDLFDGTSHDPLYIQSRNSGKINGEDLIPNHSEELANPQEEEDD